MANVNVTFKMDKNLKKEATTLFENLGMSFNQAITLFVKQALREQRIPFQITRDTPNKDTLDAFKEIELMKKGKISNKAYDNVDEMFDEVLKWNIARQSIKKLVNDFYKLLRKDKK